MTVRPADEPYVGLRPYGSGDIGRFFGRARETLELTSHVLTSRLMVVYGPSGVGKTSLLLAGALPRLGDDVAHVLPIAQLARAATSPGRASAGPNPLRLELLGSWAPDLPSAALRDMSVSRFLRDIPPRTDRYGDADLPLIVVIDQFEALFRRGVAWVGHRDELLADLGDAMENVPRLHLVLCMRQDAVGDLLPHERDLAAGNPRRRYRVPPLDRESAIEAVKGPLQTTSRRFTPGVAERLVDRLRTTTLVNEVGEKHTVVAPTVEPINLQVVCSALWHGLPDDVTTITAEHVEAYGDPQTSLTNFCARAVIDVAASQGVGEIDIWKWLEETFITDLGTRNATYEGYAWTGGMPKEVAQALERHRILHSQERSGSLWYELMHDGLIDAIRRGRHLAEGRVPAEDSEASPDAWLRMAESALRSGDLPLAEQYASGAVQASEHDPRTLAEARSFLGNLVLDEVRTATGPRRAELLASAEDHYRRAMVLFDTERNRHAVGRVMASLGRLLIEQGRLVDAVATLQGAVQRLDGDARAHVDLARALRLTGQLGAALGQYNTALNVTPGNVEALLGRAVVYAEMGDPASALRDLDDAVRLQPELAERPDVTEIRTRATAAQRRSQE
jgi:tetratricopeptide (TPR) repeat protein